MCLSVVVCGSMHIPQKMLCGRHDEEALNYHSSEAKLSDFQEPY